MNSKELLQAIRSEIERRISVNKTKNGFPAGTICAMRIEVYEGLISFLDTFQADVPKDMEEAGKDVIRQAHAHNRKFCIPDIHFDDVQLMDIFRAGVYWMAEQEHNRKEVEPEGLDEAAYKYVVSDAARTVGRAWLQRDVRHAFKAGAKWMAGQGVTKEAVIGMATKDIEINVSQRTLDALGLGPGDKVIVQIRKKEESK